MPTHRTLEDEMTTDEPAEIPPHRYTAALANEIEARWQDRWAADGTFHTPNPTGSLDGPTGDGATTEGLVARAKVYVLDMFPYPSGAGLHVGHPLGFIGTDTHARFLRMTGHNVLHAMGFDAFGLPAEQYAVQTGQHPRTTTERNVETYRAQLRRLGLAHDERRSVATTDVRFYRWTQWIFLKVFNSWFDPDQRRARPIAELVAELAAGTRPTPDGRPWAELSEVEQREVVDGFRLAYRDEAPVNWCPGLGTVLANEEVTADRRSERGNFPVFTRTLTQWKMRITSYADRLLDDLDRMDWPESIKTMQRNWIGRSTGATVGFPTEAEPIEVFTTRPDTLFGATFMVLAPEHPLADALAPEAWPESIPEEWTGEYETPAAALAAYREQAASVTDADRTAEDRTKTGVFTGGYATNPATGEVDPGVRGRLRADGLRHRRDHGRARPGPAGLGLRRRVRAAGGPHRGAAGRVRRRGVRRRGSGDQLRQRRRQPERAGGRARQGADHRLAGEHRARPRHRELQAAGLAVQPTALLGRAVPDRLRRDRSAGRPAGVDAAAGAAGDRRLLAAHLRPRRRRQPARAAAGPGDRVGRGRAGPGRRPEEVPPRAEHHAAVGRLLLVRDPLHRPDQRTSGSSTGRSSATGWVPATAATPAPATRVASTCTSAGSSTRCCTCCTPASGTRCCTTWARCRAPSRSDGCSTRATCRRTRTGTPGASWCRPPR